MVKFNVTSIFTNSAFWRILCETLFAVGKFIAFVLGDGFDAPDNVAGNS